MATVDIVIPVLNEERALSACVEELRGFLAEHLRQHRWRIVVADNGSTDDTARIAGDLAKAHPGEVACLHLDVRGRGRALRRAWLESSADVVSYMDVDLSTDLRAFPGLIGAIADEDYHVATGSRLARGSRTTRSLKREALSRTYNLLIKAVYRTRFSDAQCGFKALSGSAAKVLVPAIVDNNWFFDTELLIVAERRGFRVKDIPVTWREDPDTRVKIAGTVLEDLRGLARLRLGGIPEVEPPAD